MLSTAGVTRLASAAAALAAATTLALCLPEPAAGVAAQEGPTPHPGWPLSAFTTADFSGSGVCATCHGSLRDATGQDVSFDAHWRSTMMAQSARDPLWQAKVSAEVARAPALREIIEQKCATCHAPMARTEALQAGMPVALLGEGFLNPNHPLHEAALDGVSCTLCHQVQPEGFGTKPSFTGGYQIDLTTSPPNRVAFGPFAAPFVNPMRNASGFTPTHAAHVLDSGLCGTCHTLYTPVVNALGEVVGEFPEQTPYLEWRHSAYGDGFDEDRSCQQCHMPAAAGGVILSNRPGGRQLSPRQPMGQHHFVGGNTLVLGMLGARVGELQLTASTAAFASTARRTLAQLESRTAQVSVTDVDRSSDTLTLVVDVVNLTGHKFPTGFPSRRAWVHVAVTDNEGRIVFESGRPEAEGRIAGCDGETEPGAYEAHYDMITSAEQVQIYEAVMRDTDGAVTHTLLRAHEYAKDNRLLPLGFLAATAPADIAVRGHAAADPTFEGGGDRVTYRVATGVGSGPLTVDVALRYQTVSHAFVRDLRSTDTRETVRFGAMWDASEQGPALVSAVRLVVP